MDKAQTAAAGSGGSVEKPTDRDEALRGRAGALREGMGLARTHYGDAEADARLRAELSDWCAKESWFAGAAADCRFMHCLPVRRNVAVADEVLDGPRSVVKREAYNRLVVQMAVLLPNAERHSSRRPKIRP